MNPLPASRFLARRSIYQNLRSLRSRQPISRPFLAHNVWRASSRAYEEENAPEERPHNPYDSIGNHRRNLQEVAKLKREAAYLTVGLLASFGATLVLMYMFPLDNDPDLKKGTHEAEANAADNKEFQGRPVVVAPGGQKLVVEDPATHEQVELVPTGTAYVPHFPKTITLPSAGPNEKDSEYTLLGLGIRRVSFLNVQVYVVGLYVKNTSLAPLQASLIHHVNPLASALIPGEKEKLKSSLLDPEESQKIWNAILQEKNANIDTLFRIVPVRDTNFNHLRDGWVTGLTNKMQDASARRQKALQEAQDKALVAPSEFDDDTMALSMRNFKQLFSGRSKAPKGAIILLNRDGSGNLDALYQKKPAGGELEQVGRVEDERISRLIWLLYLGGKTVSSEEARKDIVNGVMSIVERPVGTVETQVV